MAANVRKRQWNTRLEQHEFRNSLTTILNTGREAVVVTENWNPEMNIYWIVRLNQNTDSPEEKIVLEGKDGNVEFFSSEEDLWNSGFYWRKFFPVRVYRIETEV